MKNSACLGVSTLESAEDQLDGAVDFSGLRCVEAACEVSEAAGVDCSHLIDEDEGPGAVHLDLRAEDRGLCAGGRRGDEEGGEQDRVALDRDCVPAAALLVACGVLGGAQPVEIDHHALISSNSSFTALISARSFGSSRSRWASRAA